MTFPVFHRTGSFTLLFLVALAVFARAAPVAPSNCVAAGTGYSNGSASIAISWKDNSTDETHWKIEVSLNNGASYGTLTPLVASGTTSSTGGFITVPYNNGVLGSTYLFRVSAFNGAQYSNPSNVASVTPALFPVSASLVPNQVIVNLSWSAVPNASGYEIWRAPQGGSFTYVKAVAGSATSGQVESPQVLAGGVYYFVVLPYLGNYYVGESDQVGIAVNVITSKTGTSSTAGSPFSHTFTQTTYDTVLSRSLTGVPAGLSFNNSSGVLSGVYPPVGNYTLVYTANLSNGSQLTQNFAIRVRPPAGAPLVGSDIPDWNGTAGTSRGTDLAGTFTDPEAESAVRVSTTLGDMDFILFDTATPATVANFRNYVNAGKYTDVAFHRSVSGFVVQGGGFKGAGTGSNFLSVPTNPQVVNEPGIANVRGTISMAKLGGNADSATSQFFVSLGDNRTILDGQNGGFTVFGRVAGNGMAVADAINDLPTKTYNLYLDGGAGATSFSDFPMNAPSAPAAMDQTKLVKILSASAIPTLAYSITGNTNPSVVSASVVGGQLQLTGLSGGHSTVTVTATDLDQLTNTQGVEVVVNDTFATWAARVSFPGGQNGAGQNPDGDLLANLLEYAFLGNPADAGSGAPPVQGVDGVFPAPRFVTLTFPVRKFTSGLSYVVEANSSLSGTWGQVWSSADGFNGPRVAAAVDLTDRTVVTIRDNQSLGTGARRFLRTRIVQQ